MPIVRRLVKGSRLTVEEYDGNLDHVDRLTPVILTIVSGAITIAGPGYYLVDTEGGASTDSLTAINGGLGHNWEITMMLRTAGRVITVEHTPPNLLLASPGIDFILGTLNDTIKLSDRTTTIWREVGRSNVP